MTKRNFYCFFYFLKDKRKKVFSILQFKTLNIIMANLITLSGFYCTSIGHDWQQTFSLVFGGTKRGSIRHLHFGWNSLEILLQDSFPPNSFYSLTVITVLAIKLGYCRQTLKLWKSTNVKYPLTCKKKCDIIDYRSQSNQTSFLLNVCR